MCVCVSCVFKYLPDKCWLFLFCYQNNVKKEGRIYRNTRIYIYMYIKIWWYERIAPDLNQGDENIVNKRKRDVLSSGLKRKSTVLVSLIGRYIRKKCWKSVVDAFFRRRNKKKENIRFDCLSLSSSASASSPSTSSSASSTL